MYTVRTVHRTTNNMSRCIIYTYEVKIRKLKNLHVYSTTRNFRIPLTSESLKYSMYELQFSLFREQKMYAVNLI